MNEKQIKQLSRYPFKLFMINIWNSDDLTFVKKYIKHFEYSIIVCISTLHVNIFFFT